MTRRRVAYLTPALLMAGVLLGGCSETPPEQTPEQIYLASVAKAGVPLPADQVLHIGHAACDAYDQGHDAQFVLHAVLADHPTMTEHDAAMVLAPALVLCPEHKRQLGGLA